MFKFFEAYPNIPCHACEGRNPHIKFSKVGLVLLQVYSDGWLRTCEHPCSHRADKDVGTYVSITQTLSKH